MGKPLAVEGLTLNLTAVGALRALVDFALSHAIQFYSSTGKPLPVERLSKSVKDITKANKIMAKVMVKKGKTSFDNRQDKRPFLRDCSTASRRGHYNYSFNKRDFSLLREAKSLQQGHGEQSLNISYAGKLANFVENWREITSDPTVC